MATKKMGVRPERCAYIGDQPRRDVATARKAGFGCTIILRDPENPAGLPQDAALNPDHTIYNLKEVLQLFPAHSRERANHLQADGPVYNASFSTMWAKEKFSLLSDFFLAAERLGFSKIELNHQINSGMLSSVEMDKYQISSIHEPCPADISAERSRSETG